MGKSKKSKSSSDEQGNDTRKQPLSYDPNGTHDVHRGFTDKEARSRRHHLVTSLAQKTKKRAKKGTSSIYEEEDVAASISKATQILQRKNKHQRLAKDKILESRLVNHATKQLEAKISAMDAEDILHTGSAGMIEAEHEMERTTALSQVELKRQLQDDDTGRHIYDLTMESPHGIKYDRSGRYAVLYSLAQNPQGHVALMDCHTRALVQGGEFYAQQNLRDACFLHNARMMATAAANNPVTIYDDKGVEIHSLKDHQDALKLEFLPYHFLLASIGRGGFLRYTDTTTGETIGKMRTMGMGGGADPGLRAGKPVVLRQNPHNAVLHLGHTNGTVTLWSPASQKYLVKFLCHKGASVLSMAIDMAGRTMVTGGADRQVKVWDLRNTYQCVHSYFTPAGPPTSLDISQRNILGIGHAGHTTFWSASALKIKEKSPYMHHAVPRGGPIETLRFRPFEDVCGIGHAQGISSIVIPGSGEPNLDTAEYHTNPFQDSKQRREAEVKALMDKLSPDMITLNPETIGGMEETDQHKRLEQLRDKQERANSKPGVVKKQKSKKRGRSRIQTQLRRKQKNAIDQQTLQLREAREQEKAQQAAENAGEVHLPVDTPKEQAPSALKRFFS